MKGFDGQSSTNREREMNDKELCELFGTTLEQVEKDVDIYESGDLSSFEFALIGNESIFPFDTETGASDFTDSFPKETTGAMTNREIKTPRNASSKSERLRNDE